MESQQPEIYANQSLIMEKIHDDHAENLIPQVTDCEEKAINLITYDPKDGFQVSPEAIDLLKNIKEKIGVIAVAGKYRTGKSFLLNRIILNKTDQNGFGVGPTINPCTKGLWIWNKPIEISTAPGEPPFKAFIVDSEGIGAFNEDQNHDTRIFLLALLLSSYFVYNSMGTIDENALQNLSLIVNLSKQLQIKNKTAEEVSDPDEVAKYFPSFLWVVRDFALKLLDQYGNPINSKEYLENALKEQKGNSENIEKKNRIRRMILNFFKDRDCYTMVRPTEEEKDLQLLQKLQDEKLRPEFIDQMISLRQRIFKRVKPKILNGKYITGEMFLELCQAYTEAINKGSVPCIESAWSYLCKNECQRAIQESIQLYEKNIRQEVFINPKQTDCVNYTQVKELNKKLKEQSLLYFKEKALGENVKDLEQQITDEIQKKYQIIKTKCNTIYENKCKELISKEVENIESLIRQDVYQTIQDFNQDLEKLKTNYKELTQSIIYSQKELVIRQICEKLIMKAYEAIYTKQKETLTNQNRQMTDKLQYLELSLTNKKQEFDEEKQNFQTKIFTLQSDLQQYQTNSKLYEEKYKLIEQEKTRIEVQLTEKLNMLQQSKDLNEQQHNTQLRELQAKVKTLEDQFTKCNVSYEKETALKEQKLMFTEKENQTLVHRVEQLFSENRSLQEKLLVIENQSKQTDVQVKIKDDEKRKEIEILKEFYQKKIDEAKNSEGTISVEKQKQWDQEREFLQSQLAFAQKQIEENKKMHDELLQAINMKQTAHQEQESQSQILQTNKTLSETIAKAEQRNQQLQGKLQLIKIYQRVFKHSQSMQCKFCSVFFSSEIFIEHVKCCNKDNRYTRSHFFQIPLSISIQQTRIDIDPVDNRQYTDYVVSVNFNNKQWVVVQKYKAFCLLHEKLINQYPNIKFPQGSYQFAQRNLSEISKMNGGSGSSSIIEDRRKILQQYLQELALIPAIKESPQLKQFLMIHEHFPEFCQDVSNSMVQEQKQQRGPNNHVIGNNFKIMNDLFLNQGVRNEQIVEHQNNLSIEDLLNNNDRSHFSGFNQSINNISRQRNRYESISSSATPEQKKTPYNDNNLDELSSIEGVILEDQESMYEEQNHHHPQQEPQISESPLKIEGQQQQIFQGNECSKSHAFYQNFDQEIARHEQTSIKKSTSSNNLVYSPSQIQSSQVASSMMLQDRTNQNQGKNNCLACHHQKIVEKEVKKSQEIVFNMLQKNANQQHYNKSAQSNKEQSQNVIMMQESAQKNVSLLEELVHKGTSKQQPKELYSHTVTQRSALQKQKLETFITPREFGTYTQFSNIKNDTAMRSDKILADLMVNKEKPLTQQSVQTYKKTTPVKQQLPQNSGQKQYQQQTKSPYSNQKSNTSGIMQHNNSTVQITPDQLQRKSQFEYSIPHQYFNEQQQIQNQQQLKQLQRSINLSQHHSSSKKKNTQGKSNEKSTHSNNNYY